MDNQHYTVILSYDPDNLEVHRKVVASLSRLNPTAGKRFSKNNSGRIILKRDADAAAARRLKQIFNGTGAQCEIQKVSSPSAQYPGRPATSPDPLDASSSSRSASPSMACPNCGHEQIADVECKACGIIFSKARPGRETSNMPAASFDERPSNSSAASALLGVVTRISSIMAGFVEHLRHYFGIDKLSGWTGRVADRLIRCGIAFIIALLLEVGFAFFLKMSWFLIIETVAGKHFIKTHPEQTEMFQSLAAIDPLTLAWGITTDVLWLGLLVGCAAQLLHLIRYLYLSQQLIGKLVIWFGPFIVGAAWTIGQREPYPDMILASTMVAIPALCLLPSCLHLSRALLPGIGEFKNILAAVLENRENTWGHMIKKIRKWLD